MRVHPIDAVPSAAFVRQRPEPGSWWIAYRPRQLAVSKGFWIDLASAGLLDARVAGSKARLSDRGFDDLVYLPPVGESQEETWVEWYRCSIPFAVVQRAPGEEVPTDGAALVIFDLLLALLDGKLSRCDLLPSGTTVAWPLIAGVTDSERMARDWLPRLVARGTERVKAFTLHLTQRQRRRLAERLPESAFTALFHRSPGEDQVERRWARWIAHAGMSPFVERPSVPLAEPMASHRRAAGVLLEVGDLWIRLGRSPAEGQSFYRAAREVERSSHDLVRLAREENLGVFPWLQNRALEVVRDALLTAATPLRDTLRREYLEGDEAPL